MPGVFVVLEGGEGAGKSTQCRRLADSLRFDDHDVVLTREPGGTRLGEEVREVLLGAGSQGMAARTEALLFAAARAEHAHAVIRPALARGAIVVCDRYIDSSVAYQGAGRGLGEQRIAEISGWATDDLVADLTVLLDLPVDVGLARANDGNRMEREPSGFHEQVRRSLLARAAARPTGYLVLAAQRPADQVAAQIRAAVNALLTHDGRPPVDLAPPDPA